MASKATTPSKTDTISLGEAAHMLQTELGSLRQWVAFLNDINKGKPTSIHGVSLLACAQQHDGKQWRPRYALIDVLEFISRVQALDSNARPAKIEPIALMIHKRRFWKANTFDKDGNPISKAMKPLPPMSHSTGQTCTGAMTH